MTFTVVWVKGAGSFFLSFAGTGGGGYYLPCVPLVGVCVSASSFVSAITASVVIASDYGNADYCHNGDNPNQFYDVFHIKLLFTKYKKAGICAYAPTRHFSKENTPILLASRGEPSPFGLG
jgi:hypothetical protein